MKKILALLLLLPILSISCKKKPQPVYTYMKLFVDNDSAWTATDVTSQKQDDGSVIITATNSAKAEKVTFTLHDYRDGRKTYSIGSGSQPGYSYGSAATYDYGGYLAKGAAGQVEITNFTTHIIEGTFDVPTDKVRISGTFGAPIPQ